jgi:hypothetical protein
MSTKVKYWIAGIGVIVIGLVLARVIAPMYYSQTTLQWGYSWQEQ